MTSRDRQFLVRQGKGGTEKRGASQGPDSLRLLIDLHWKRYETERSETIKAGNK